MKTIMTAAFVVGLGVPAVIIYVNAALHLMSQPADMAVLGGYLMLAAVALAAACGVVAVAGRLRKVLSTRDGRKDALLIIPMFLLIGLNYGCNVVVQPGHVGLLVKQTGSDRGVQDYPIQTGRVFYNPLNENVLVYPTFVQRTIWTKAVVEGHPINEEITFQSKEGLQFTADVNIAYEIVREMVPHFYVRFRNDDIDSFTHGFLHDTVRNSLGAVSTGYTAEEINGSRQAVLINAAAEHAKMLLSPLGVSIVQLGFSAPPRPPDPVRLAIEGKIAAVQEAERVENQKRSSVAEGEKIKALASATAEANRLVNSSLTPTLIQWRQLDILQSKWNGQMPQVVGSGGVPLLNIGK